ncbi:hypothetical protein M378DRAFT_912954 [Amanita muscaria Koide BX008]|uniref:Uncharacterized protein n=1 Tax=Amanita muscaria (strain Koide BX008) TaxID=946122 RepID=A0A0C2SCK9_AMAMK|nr:hypothetical protein M378DRAFT_912954 [Amanita muscaria Koide BX008]
MLEVLIKDTGKSLHLGVEQSSNTPAICPFLWTPRRSNTMFDGNRAFWCVTLLAIFKRVWTICRRQFRLTITTILTLLIRLAENNTSSGHTLLFGPLFFGLGPASLAFHHVYLHYLRTAWSIFILAFIRWQYLRARPSGSAAAALGVPARLKDWIKRYPASLPFLNDPKKDTTAQRRTDSQRFER